MEIGFIGTGRMGLGMARNLLKAGHRVSVFNRSRERAEPLVADGATLADTPAAAAASAELLVTMVADDAAAAAVLEGDSGALAGLPRGAVHASMSTLGVATVDGMGRTHRERGVALVSAPVFGRPEAAEAAKLWIVAGGSAAAVDRCRPAFDAMGQGTIHVGDDPALANTFKLGGNFLLAAAIEALAEAVTLVRKSGGDGAQFLDIMGKLFRSPIYENYGRLIVEQRFEPAGFALRLGLKDVRLALAAADGAAVPMALASVLHDRYLSAANAGLGDADWAALGVLAAREAGLG